MKGDYDARNFCGTNISHRDATIFLLFVDLIISTLCVFLFVTTYFCNASNDEYDRNNWFLFVFFIWHASKLVIVSLGIVGSFKSIPLYLIPYICYWAFLTAFLLLYSLFVVMLSITMIKNKEDYAVLQEANETSTSYILPTKRILQPMNAPQWVLQYSMNNVALITASFIVTAVFSGYFTTVIYGFYTSLKKEVQTTVSQLPEPPEATNLPAQP